MTNQSFAPTQPRETSIVAQGVEIEVYVPKSFLTVLENWFSGVSDILTKIRQEFGNGDVFFKAEGIENVPELGSDGGFVDAYGANDMQQKTLPAMQKPNDVVFVFQRIATNIAQNYLAHCGMLLHTSGVEKNLDMKITYQTGDVITSTIQMNGWHFQEVAKGNDSLQMMGIKGKPQGVPEHSFVMPTTTAKAAS